MTTVDDGRRRRLIVLGCGRFGPESGLAPIAGIDDEIGLVVEAFAAMGYDCPADHRLVDLDAPAAVARTAGLIAACDPDDVVGLYVTGHGEVVGGSLVMHASGSRAGTKVDVVTVPSLLAGLYERDVGERCRNLLILLDVCAAGIAVEQAVVEVRAALSSWRAEPGTATGVTVVAATRAGEAARASAFARSWHTAVLASDIAPRDQPYLSFPTLADRVQGEMGAQITESVAVQRLGDEVCLPNPRHHLTGIDPHLLVDVWEPAARALPGRRAWARLPTPWLFSGRQRVNEHLARWLVGEEPDPVVVLTGAPGSGKSTILGRLVVLTVPDLRRELAKVGVDVAGPGAPPDGFSFAATITASRASTESVFRLVARALGLRERSDLHALTDDPGSGPAPVILLDALDEAEDPHDLVVEVLRPLAQAARAGRVRLIVATRENPVGHDPDDPKARRGDLITPLLAASEPVRVDHPTWLATGDIAEYCERVLSVPRNDAGRINPYAVAERDRRVLARAIEQRAHHSFLLAALVARRHTLDAACVDPDGRSWHEQFPEHIGDAMRAELSALHGHREAARQLALLRPLALAHGIGLSRDPVADADLWSLMATALGGEQFDADAVTGLLEQRSATHLVSRADSAGHAVYRLHHEALAEALRPVGAAELRTAHAVITEALLSLVDADDGWDLPYLRRALPFHAGLGDRLDYLSTLPDFLCRCDPDQLNAAFGAFRSDLAAGRLVRPYVHRLRALPPGQRAFLLGTVACVAGHTSLGLRLLDAAECDVGVRAAEVRPEPQRQVVADGKAVEALVATRDRTGTPLLFLGNGSYLEVREPDSGMLVESVLVGPSEITGLCATRDSDGFPVVLAGGADGAVMVDATTREVRASVHAAFHRGIAVSPGESADFLVVGWTEERIDLWRPGADRELDTLPVEWAAGTQPITSAAILESGDDEQMVAVAAGGEVVLWDATGAGIVDVVQPADTINLSLTTLCPRDSEHTLLVTTGTSYRTATVWRPSTGALDWTHGEVPICAAGWTGDGDSLLVLGYPDGTVRVWRPDSDTIEVLGTLSFSVQDVAVGPESAMHPLIVAIDRIGVARSWSLLEHTPGAEIAARQPHCIDLGTLPNGKPYLAIGGSRGAEVWHLDHTVEASDALHAGDAHRLVYVHGPEPAVVTAGDDGTLRVWQERGSPSPPLAIPTGGVNDVLCWQDGDTGTVMLAAMNMVLEFDVRTPALRHTYELPAGPTRLARGGPIGRPRVAAAARTRLYVIDSSGTEPWAFDLPLCYPGTSEPRTTAARTITALEWVDAPQQDAELIIATAGGSAMVVRVGDGRVHGIRGLADGMGIVLVLRIVTSRDGPAVVLGTRNGVLRVIDVATGHLVHDLSKDDARIAGATTVRTEFGRHVLVTTHCDRDVHQVTGLRIWDLDTGDLMGTVLREASGDPFIGPPRAGRTRTGTPFVAYLVEDGVEVTLLDDELRRRHLPLPITANDLWVEDETLYVAGGGGYLALTVGAGRGSSAHALP